MRHPINFYASLLKTLKIRNENQYTIAAQEFFEYLRQKNDTKALKKILEKFARDSAREDRIAHVVIECANISTDVTEDLKKSIKHKLRTDYADVLYGVREVTGLGGGLRLLVNKSFAIDASLRDLVQSLAQKV